MEPGIYFETSIGLLSLSLVSSFSGLPSRE